MKQGFAVCGVLFLLGLLLQVLVGEVQWDALAWPVNIFLLAAWLVIISDIFFLRRRVRFFEWMMHNGAGVPALVFALAMTLVMGLVTQGETEVPMGMPAGIPAEMAEALSESGMMDAMSSEMPSAAPAAMPWLGRMLRFWPFVLAWGWMLLIAGLAALNHLLRWKLREIPFVLNHLGLFVAVVAATLGSPDKQDLRLMAFTETPEWRAVDDNGALVELDFAVTLHKFIMETYDDGSPRRFASEVTIAPRASEETVAQHGSASAVMTQRGGAERVAAAVGCTSGTVEVNKPLRYGGWKIYQYDYDAAAGADSAYSTFELVRDPWLWAVYAGIFMMLVGAVCLMLFMAPKPVREDESEEGETADNEVVGVKKLRDDRGESLGPEVAQNDRREEV